MKASLLLVAALSAPLMASAADPVSPSRRESLSPARIMGEFGAPIDNMPIIGDQTPLLRNRLSNLEERLRKAEEAQGKAAASASGENPNSSSFGERMRTLEERIRNLESKADASNRTAIPSSIKSDDPSDIYVQAFTLCQSAERATGISDRASARQSLEKARQLLTTIQQSYPQWQPAMVQYRMKKIDVALEELNTDQPAERKGDPTKLLLEGIEHYQAGRFDETVNSLTKSLAIDPKNAFAHLWLSRVAKKKGWIEASEKELETARKLDPTLKPGDQAAPPATPLKPESGPSTPPPID